MPSANGFHPHTLKNAIVVVLGGVQPADVVGEGEDRELGKRQETAG